MDLKERVENREKKRKKIRHIMADKVISVS